MHVLDPGSLFKDPGRALCCNRRFSYEGRGEGGEDRRRGWMEGREYEKRMRRGGERKAERMLVSDNVFNYDCMLTM